jgi:hypothetical protein
VKNMKKAQREEQRERQRKYQLKKRSYIASIFGSKCSICNSRRYLALHRKDGEKHKRWQNMGWDRMIAEFTPNTYARVCISCHRHIHWCMRHLKLSYDDVVDLALRSKGK